eukprot:NODE_2326_length_943_cov_194.525727_g1913_i0.p1 GENE.NODE_2326_length_943_cov_194.525727_g1913_i0~~NODE_2326_length_943_cov_194.525727_g1913_i0.p1  ORF type:complete len:106 (-),score=7.92 NODE_2326_length_943_cov_194.525727_g1913_i0:377-694(-)
MPSRARTLEAKEYTCCCKHQVCCIQRDLSFLLKQRVLSSCRRRMTYVFFNFAIVQQDLAEENNQLMEDNESLREEKTLLEETISELRYELDMKDVISDDVCSSHF